MSCRLPRYRIALVREGSCTSVDRQSPSAEKEKMVIRRHGCSEQVDPSAAKLPDLLMVSGIISGVIFLSHFWAIYTKKVCFLCLLFLRKPLFFVGFTGFRQLEGLAGATSWWFKSTRPHQQSNQGFQGNLTVFFFNWQRLSWHVKRICVGRVLDPS